MIKKLTPAQTEILHYIKERCAQTGAPPSYREIQARFGYKSVNSVQTHIEALRKKGLLEAQADRRQARGLLPIGHKQEKIQLLPVYGEIAAGSPRDSAQIELGSVVISNEFSSATFALRVRGESMVDVGIFEGDFLIVEKRTRAKSGDIVVALLDGETTVKRYLEKSGEVFLIPENRSMKPISVRGKKLEIQGRVVGLQRKI